MSALMLGNVPVVGWMLYTIVISGVVTLAALAAHDAQRASNRAVRWVWLAAVASIITLGAAAPFRDRAVVASDGDAGIASPERGELAIAGTGEGARYWVVRVRDALSAPLRLTLQRTQSLTGPIPSPVHQAVTLLWFGASAAMALVFPHNVASRGAWRSAPPPRADRGNASPHRSPYRARRGRPRAP
jgi:hypothetical protein